MKQTEKEWDSGEGMNAMPSTLRKVLFFPPCADENVFHLFLSVAYTFTCLRCMFYTYEVCHSILLKLEL